MPVQDRKEKTLIVFFATLILFLDQSSKFIVDKFLPKASSLPIIKNVLHLTYVQNTGAAFGIFKNAQVFFIIVSSLAIIFIVSALFLKSSPKVLKGCLSKIALAMILGGATGNLLDRLRFGYCIDFIDVRIWPVFNIADSAITIGALLLIFKIGFSRPNLENPILSARG